MAKDVFRLHGVNEDGKKVLQTALPKLIAQLPSCEIVMEACGSSNYWSRKFIQIDLDTFAYHIFNLLKIKFGICIIINIIIFHRLGV